MYSVLFLLLAPSFLSSFHVSTCFVVVLCIISRMCSGLAHHTRVNLKMQAARLQWGCIGISLAGVSTCFLRGNDEGRHERDKGVWKRESPSTNLGESPTEASSSLLVACLDPSRLILSCDVWRHVAKRFSREEENAAPSSHGEIQRIADRMSFYS